MKNAPLAAFSLVFTPIFSIVSVFLGEYGAAGTSFFIWLGMIAIVDQLKDY